MFVFNQEVFDEIITGTTSTWYTAAAYNSLLGSADAIVILAHPTSVVAPSTLTAYLDTSSDNQHWILGEATLWSNQTLSEGVVLVPNDAVFMRHAFARIRITLGGAGAQCRLKIGVTGRNV